MEPPPRVESESESAYALFVRWLVEVGPEEVGKSAEVARRLDVTPAKLKTLKSRHKWAERRREAGWDAAGVDEPAAVALVGEIVETHRERAERRSEAAASGAVWRDDIGRAARAIAATGPLAAKAVASYYKMVSDSGGAPTELRDAAALALRHFFPPDLAREVMTEAGEDAKVRERARVLGLTHPERAGDNLRELADRINAAAAITDPRPPRAVTESGE
jgi:hypothetical protein